MQVEQDAPLAPQVLVVGALQWLLPSQQPFGQEFALQTQTPFRQYWPLTQTGPLPQPQLPLTQTLAFGPQVVQLPPLAPQVFTDGVMQVLPAQQPVAHEVASQTHWLLTQCWPAAQAGLLPQAQLPFRQVLAVVGLQAEQAAPLVPQPMNVGMVQVLFWQQPFGQERPLQRQLPLRQAWPTGQIGPLPQAQPPLVQRFARLPQLVHWPPPPPHAPEVTGCTHWPFWQQPYAQEIESQMQRPLAQRWPVAQTAPPPQEQAPFTQLSAYGEAQVVQAPPPRPQFETWLMLQVVPLQQPFGQLVASQTHWPLTQRWPEPQAALKPHLHWPPPQLSAMAPQLMQAVPWLPHWLTETVWQRLPWQQAFGQLVASQVQAPFTQCWPAAQGAPVPHLQAPLVQLSAVMPQATQARPEVPQLPRAGWVQLLPAQQPCGHEVESQTQAPLTQCWPMTQAEPVPHAQAPLRQESALPAAQAEQLPPIGPQALVETLVQTLPAQQPVVQEFALQTQAPLTHCWPGWQAGPVPQEQPLPVQALAVTVLQATHAAPPVPHAESVLV